MKHAVAIDFGSTFTKIVCVDLEEKKILLSGKTPSTVNVDANIGLQRCFGLARTVITEDEFQNAVKLASSSAAGGLRMAVIGLTESLSTMAGNSAALGAGAKICAACGGILKEDDIAEIENCNAEIILLCGGYEHGNTDMLLNNARLLAESRISAPIIYAGNSDIVQEVRMMMSACRKQCYVAENIIPGIGQLNAEPVQDVIRNLFLERITDMKGMCHVKRYFDHAMIPTPAAVLQAGLLLSGGTAGKPGMGALMIVDVGGSTTDVYSFCENKAADGAKCIGLAEPYGKRTVEGDLGMRENFDKVVKASGIDMVVGLSGVSAARVEAAIHKRTSDISYVPVMEEEKKIDAAVARIASAVASRRHAGRTVPSYMKDVKLLQYGKNLTEVSKIIGTGGILAYSADPSAILKSVERQDSPDDRQVLLPEKMETYVDTEYVLFAAGLLKGIDEEAAYKIMKDSIKHV